jgi:carboxyl-terminal processing protease
MARTCFSITLALLLSFAFGMRAYAADPLAFKFQGIEPGVSTEKDLLANKRWGKPVSREAKGDSSSWLTYQLRGYKNIGVLIRGDIVQTIDIPLPDGLTVEAVASAFKLGSATKDEIPPPAAIIGPPLPQQWDRILYAPRRALLLVDRDSGQARQLRVYADSIAQQSVLKPVLDEPPPTSGKTPQVQSSLKGPNAGHRQIVNAAVKLLEREHLSRHPLDDQIAQRAINAFIKSLDPAKMYFTQDDVKSFTRHYDLFDDQLGAGDLSQAYEMFRKFLERVRQRVALVEELIEADHDFTLDESLVAKYDNVAFPENELEVREIWRKRVKHDLLVHKAAGADLDEARRRVRQQYHNYLQQVHRNDDLDLLQVTLNAVTAAYDPHSKYLSERTVADFRINVAAEMVGLGAQLKMANGYISVTKVIPGGPADIDGRLKPGDRILAVGQDDGGQMVDAINQRLSDIVKLIRGKADTKVRLRVLPQGEFESSIYEITRGKVELQKIGHAVLTGEHLPGGRTARVGYVYLPTFYLDMEAKRAGRDDYRSTTRDMKNILTDFSKQNVDVVVIDLMNNGGGSLTEAINLPGLFLDGEPVTVQVKDKDGRVQSYAALKIDKVWDGPLVVLTNRVSAGGSEILAGAIQDYQRGLVIGDSKTHGLGTVANVMEIGRTLFRIENPPKLGHLKIVTQRFYRPGGDSMQMRGIVPDVVVPSLTDHMDLGEEHLDYALKFDKLRPANYTASKDFPLDDEARRWLNDSSGARRSGSAYFQGLTQKIARYSSSKNAPIPLNEEKYVARQSSTDAKKDAANPIPGIGDRKLDGYTNEVLSIALDYASRLHFARAEKLYKAEQFSAALDSYRKAVASDPGYTDAHYKYAWYLGTSRDANFRNGKLAVTHATKACEKSEWKKWSHILCLSIAMAESGDFDGALKHLKSALDKAPPNLRARYEYLQRRFEQRQTYASR